MRISDSKMRRNYFKWKKIYGGRLGCGPRRQLCSFFNCVLAALIGSFAPVSAWGFQKPARDALPNYDRRDGVDAVPLVSPEQTKAADELRRRVPKIAIDFHPVTLSPSWVS